MLGLRQQAMGHPSRDPDNPFLFVRLITVPICNSGQICKHARPTPAVGLIFSRNARPSLFKIGDTVRVLRQWLICAPRKGISI